ncbi:helix-turn-helix transcriptional regulator [Salmonella enterica subsp. enterica serovar Saintpaul]|nr:helix-turn-helix transcriptional regulator [Salmonella enterica subsp. enterica serovar Saintpaul]EKP7930638.1 helix-turn-helix transcriptional regulator [Salmonella enterica]
MDIDKKETANLAWLSALLSLSGPSAGLQAGSLGVITFHILADLARIRNPRMLNALEMHLVQGWTRDRERWSVLLAGYRWLPCDGDMVNVRETLLDILNTPGSAVLPRVNLNRCRLSSRQQHILDETLAGRSVRDIAAHLEISERAVFSARAALIMKIGLNNRMELMSLAGDVSGCFKFL